jgi:hypothetical protein
LPLAVIKSALAIAADQRAGGKTVTITSTIADLTGRLPRTVAESSTLRKNIFLWVEECKSDTSIVV